MKKLFAAIGVINWKTTMTGISGVMLSLGVIANAWRTKDFETIFTQAQTLVPIIFGAILFLQGLVAKDSTVTGAGALAATVDEKGNLKNINDKTIDTQPVVPAK